MVEEHVSLLLEYMYCGTIAVDNADLTELMQTASSLQIRGFSYPATTNNSEEYEGADSPKSLVVDEQTQESSQHQETSLLEKIKKVKTKKRKVDGRKASIPKKLKITESNTQPDNDVRDEETQNDSNIDSTRYSILGSYINSCRSQKRESISAASEDDNDEKQKLGTPGAGGQANLDIADRRRSHFLASIPSIPTLPTLPTPSYDWLRNVQSPNKDDIPTLPGKHFQNNTFYNNIL